MPGRLRRRSLRWIVVADLLKDVGVLEVNDDAGRGGLAAEDSLARVARTRYAVGDAFDFTFRRVVDDVSGLGANAAAKFSRAGGVAGVAAKKIKHGEVHFEPLRVGDA